MSKRSSYTDVINMTQGSVSLPGHGILRAGKIASVETDLLNTRDYRDFLSRGIIAIGGFENLKKKEKQAKKTNAKDLSKGKKGKSIKRVGGDGDDSEFENGVEPGEEDGIIFVDIEQTKERIANHPILSKLDKRTR